MKEASTVVTVDTGTPVTVTSAGDLYSYKLSNTAGPTVVTSDKEMMLAQFALSQAPGSSNQDPVSMVVAASEQWRPQYTFSTSRAVLSGQTHYMLIVIESARLPNLMHNGVIIDITGWTAFPAPQNAFVGKAVSIQMGEYN